MLRNAAAGPQSGKAAVSERRAKNSDVMDVSEKSEFHHQGCYSTPSCLLPLENKNWFYILMDLITAWRSEQIKKGTGSEDATMVC